MMETEAVVAQGTLTVTCPRDELTRAIGIVSRGVSSRTTVQILAGILLRTAGGKLELAATDMELSLRTSIDVAGRDRGFGRRAGSAAARSGAPAARCRGDDRAQARGGGGRGSLRLGDLPAAHLQRRGLSAAARSRGGRAARGRPRDVADTVARVSRSASRDESRPVLTGVLVRFEPAELVMAATDSYRLSVKETAVEGTVPELEAIVPARALGELARIAQDGDEARARRAGEPGRLRRRAMRWLTTRRIDGQFPNYKQLVPETFEHEVAAAAGGAARRRPPRLGDGPAQLAATAALRRGRADRLRADPGRRRGPGVAAGSLQRRAARDRLQRGVPARRDRVGARRRAAAEADQPAPPRPCSRARATTSCT